MKLGVFTRRQALTRLLKVAAVAAGLGAAESKALFAQLRKQIKRKAIRKTVIEKPDVTNLINIQATDKNVKALKVLLMPRSQMSTVFASEFGRTPTTARTRNIHGVPVCGAYIGLGGRCGHLDCGVHVCNSETCPYYANRGPAFDINFLSKMNDCETKCNHCAAKDKPCWFNKKSINLGEVQSNWMREVQDDPFMKALFKEFNTTSPSVLERELKGLLNQRKANLR